MDLKRQVRRKLSKKKAVQYSPRKDRSYLKGRTHKDFIEFMEMNPDASIVEMDTVYNDGSNGPFLQTFKFLNYDFLFCVYHQQKTSENMLEGILYLETILGEALFNEEVMVLKTDRGSEFVLADSVEIRKDGTEEQDSFIAIRWPAGKRAHLKMFIYSSGRFVLSRLIYTLSAWIRKKRRISSHPISIPITKRS